MSEKYVTVAPFLVGSLQATRLGTPLSAEATANVAYRAYCVNKNTPAYCHKYQLDLVDPEQPCEHRWPKNLYS